MAILDVYVFPGFLTLEITQLLFPKPPTTFLTCFCRGEKRKNARKKVHLNQGSNSQSPGHASDTLTTEPPMQGGKNELKLFTTQSQLLMTLSNEAFENILVTSIFSFSQKCFLTFQKQIKLFNPIYFIVCKCLELGLV